MKIKNDAHEALSLIFQQMGVLDKIIVNESKQRVLGNFHQKRFEVGFRMKQKEPHSSWQNSVEVSIQKLIRGAGRKMTKSISPKSLLDHCLEL